MEQTVNGGNQFKAELSGNSLFSASMKLMPCGYKAELSGKVFSSVFTKLMPCGYKTEVGGKVLSSAFTKVMSCGYKRTVSSVTEQSALLPSFQRLSIVSYNIQAGIHSSRYRHYLTRSWQHLLPTKKKRQNLDRIAGLLRSFDIVGLQEVDSGGSRSEFIDQTEYLAYHAGFPFWSNQINRRLGRLALHSNGLLSRLKPHAVHDYKLPGLPGRGALLIRFGEDESPFYLCILHLALGRNARKRQLGFVAEVIQGLPRVIVMGDLNCEVHSPEMRHLLDKGNLIDPVQELKTYPSWNPRRKLDHLLVTPDLRTENVRAINFAGSDHLPVAMDIFVPVTHKKEAA